MNFELLQYVYDELLFIQNNWDNKIEDSNLRRNSNILRELLVNGKLLRAWKEIGFARQPTIITPTLELVIGFFGLEKIVFAMAGEGTFGGATISEFLILNYTMSAEEVKILHDLDKNSDVNMGLAEFLNKPCIIKNSITINRLEVINYVANKLGGTHLDFKRNLKKLKEQKYLVLDSIRYSELRIIDKDPIYLQLLSIGQMIANSKSVEKLKKKIEEVIY